MDKHELLNNRRTSGLLLHPTSLPGCHGIGELGQAAYDFVDFLVASGQQCWQVLPLGPPDDVHSPYQGASSMAGNPLLLSLETLVAEGWLAAHVLREVPAFPTAFVDYEAVIPWKAPLLRHMATACVQRLSGPERLAFEEFCAAKRDWLDDFARFMALKEANQGLPWPLWTHRRPDAVAVAAHKFLQFQFFRQWQGLRQYCHKRGISLIGDIPIYVAHDSADVWGSPDLFVLDETGDVVLVAGVPPDYFSRTGQRWGNPLYRWDVMADTGYQWWMKRVRAALELVDMVRLDHFRGLERYYAIPASSPDAVQGEWLQGPGDPLLAAMQQDLGRLPFIAEDLGYITPAVVALRERWGLPGMRVLQFAFGSDAADNPHKPHNYVQNCVVYTGTHDNDTTLGWFASLSLTDRARVKGYLPSDGAAIHWDMLRVAFASVAAMAIVPVQDVLGLGTTARMNIPGTRQRNWRWRLQPQQLQPQLSAQLYDLTVTYGRQRS